MEFGLSIVVHATISVLFSSVLMSLEASTKPIPPTLVL